jgi:tetratricopeptide (TPR) repeat protein
MAGSGGVFAMGAFEDSLASYLRAGESPRALFGASRAAYQLDRQDQALALADRGMQARAANAQPSVSDTFAYRTLAQAAWLAYVRAKQALPEAPSDAELARTAALFERARGGLGELLGRVAADADVWDKLSQIYEWEARYAEAQDTLAAGLDRQPNDPVLLRRLEAVAKRSGPDAVIAAFEDLLARHPEIGEAWYRVGWYRFERALSALEGGGNPAAEFERAESELARARKLVPARKQDCLGYEVVCRDGVGWCRYNQGDLEGAEAAFRSMEQLFDGGLAWFFEGRLLSGVQGLHFTGAAYAGRSADYAGSPIAKPEHLSRAAAIYGYLAEYQPNDPTWANNAGFFHRDARAAASERPRAATRSAPRSAPPPTATSRAAASTWRRATPPTSRPRGSRRTTSAS